LIHRSSECLRWICRKYTNDSAHTTSTHWCWLAIYTETTTIPCRVFNSGRLGV